MNLMWDEIKKKYKIPNITSEELNEKLDPVLRSMEEAGIKLDVVRIEKMADEAESETKEIEQKVFELAGEDFNINSPVQLSEILFNKMKLPTTEIRKNRKSGNISTAASELRKISKHHPIITEILRYRELTKLITTYLRPLPLLVDKNHRLHTSYGQDTTTGRLNSSEPNLQNIPIKGEFGGEMRKAFIAEEGMMLVAADYSQIELRIVARLSGDTTMLEAFENNIDIHSNTASEIFNLELNKVTKNHRRIAKSVNFGVIYGMSPYGLSQALGIEQEEARKYIYKFFETHQGIRNYCDQTIEFVRKHGYVETLLGMKRYLPNIKSHLYQLRESEERMAINTPVQGTAAEVLKLAMISLDKNLKKFKDTRMLLSVHDELVIEVNEKLAKKAAKLIIDSMESVIDIGIPLLCEIGVGKNWGELEGIDK